MITDRVPLGWYIEGSWNGEPVHKLSARFVVHGAAEQFAELAKRQSLRPSSIVIRGDYGDSGSTKRGRR